MNNIGGNEAWDEINNYVTGANYEKYLELLMKLQLSCFVKVGAALMLNRKRFGSLSLF